MADEVRVVLAVLGALPALALAGCGGGKADSASLSTATLPQRAGEIETNATGLVFRDREFSFEMPKGWAQFVTPTAVLGADAAVGAALVAPDDSAAGSIHSVFVGVYDVAIAPAGRLARDVDEYFDDYAATSGVTVTERPKPVTLGEYPAHVAGLASTVDGSLVKIMVVRALRGDLMYLVHCQTNERDSAGINAGCRKIVDSFRAP